MRARIAAPALWLTVLLAGGASIAGAQVAPAGDQAANPSRAPDRSHPPELGPPPSLTLPAPERFQLDNGLQVVLLERHAVPVVQINLLVRSGSTDDPPGRSGLAALTADLLDEGAGGRDALELADAIDYLGASLSTFAREESSGVDLYAPLARLDDALALMADVALRPAFPASELDRRRAERLTDLLQARDEPRSIAAVLFRRSLFGPGHPYGASADESSLRAISREDLGGFYEAHYRPEQSVLIVVGDVTAASMRPKLEAAFGAWDAGGAGGPAGAGVRADADHAPPRPPIAPQVKGREILLVDKPGAAQSEIRIGRIGYERHTADYYPLLVMNTILGGSFTSRLNSNLREDKGYSYGAFSSFSFRRSPGPFVAQAAVQTDVTDKALTEFFRELRDIRENIGSDEIRRAKNYLALRFPRRFQSVGQVAGQIEQLLLYELPLDTYNSYVERVQAVTESDVRRVAAAAIDPDNVRVIVVGDREKIDAGVRALGLGVLRELSVEDVLGPPPKLSEKSGAE